MSDFTLEFTEQDDISLTVDASPSVELCLGAETGTRDYNALTNKPSIESVVLVGNKTFKQLGLEPITPQEIDKIIFG